MAGDGTIGSDWTPEQIDLIVADTFAMLADEIAGRPFVKARRNEAMQALTGRSRGSVEFKHQNAAARTCAARAARETRKAGRRVGLSTRSTPAFAGAGSGFTPVTASSIASGLPHFDLHGLHQPLDACQVTRPIASTLLCRPDQRTRAEGRHASKSRDVEARLAGPGRPCRSRRLLRCRRAGCGAGYDIASFAADGRERLIEVKTTVGGARTPFWLSENERAFSEERPDAFRLVRVYDFARRPMGWGGRIRSGGVGCNPVPPMFYKAA